MRILLTSPTLMELKKLLNQLDYRQVIGSDSFSISLGKTKIDVLISGIGMVSTAFRLGNRLHKQYDFALQTGIAGSFSDNYPPGSLVHVTSDCFSGLGMETEQGFVPASEMKIDICPGPAFEDGWLHNNHMPQIALLDELPVVKGITVNTVHGHAGSIAKLRKLYNPNVETMEGAAFLYACKLLDLPCLQIRSISNYVLPRSRQQWDMEFATDQLADFGKRLLDEIKK